MADTADDSVRRGIAYHEAGHAVVGTRMGLEVVRTDIVPDGMGGRGHTTFAQPWSGFNPRPGHVTVAERGVVVRFAVTFMAGFAAEARLGQASLDGSGYDEKDVMASWIALLADDETQRHALAASCLARAEVMLADVREWQVVVAVAQRLITVSSLAGAEVRDLLRTENG